MAHFAELDENNVVVSIHVVNNDILKINDVESEQAGVDFLNSLYGHSRWKQTSYNNSFRKNYAGIESIYNEDIDAFVAKQPYPSWTLDEDSATWIPPIPKPYGEDQSLDLVWDESTNSWIDVSILNVGVINE